jgi:transposase
MDIIVGIDVSKDRLDVYVMPFDTAFHVENRHAGIYALVRRLKTEVAAERNCMVALEAIGGFEMLAAAALSSAGLTVLVVNPAQVRAYAQALGRRAKTDPIDAAVIAAFVAATRPEIRPLRDAETRALSALVARRQQIVEMIVAEENRLRMVLAKQAQKSIKHLLAELPELDSLDRRQIASLAWLAPWTRQSDK